MEDFLFVESPKPRSEEWISLILAAVCSPVTIQLTLGLKVCFSAITEYQKCSVVIFYVRMPLLPEF